jgi:hypothetical protein
MKLTRKEITQACARYARKHGYHVGTVRTVTVLWTKAVQEWRAKQCAANGG